jgi:hypothetical protein
MTIEYDDSHIKNIMPLLETERADGRAADEMTGGGASCYDSMLYTFFGTIGGLSFFIYLIYRSLRTSKGIMMIYNMVTPFLKNKSDISVTIKGRTMVIEYSIGTRKHKLILPYDKKNHVRDSSRSVTIEYPDGSKETVHHPPGVPMLVDETHLDAKKVHVTYED